MWRETQIFVVLRATCFPRFVYCLMNHVEPSYEMNETVGYSAFRMKVPKILANNRSDCCDDKK